MKYQKTIIILIQILSILQSMPQCKDLLLHCTWQNAEIDCLRLFKVMTTDDGFCCVFNAYNPKELLKNSTT